MEILNVTLNPKDMGSNNVLSSGNLTVTNSSSTGIRATHGRSSGKWYWEMKLTSTSEQVLVGIANKSLPLSLVNLSNTNQRTYYGFFGKKHPESTDYGPKWETNEVIGIALDLDIGTLEFYKNGVTMGISHTNVKELGEVYPLLYGVNSQVNTVTFNFGASPFTYHIPYGFYSYDGRQAEWYNKFLISSENGEIFSPQFADQKTNTVPIMTSNNSPSGVASASTFNNHDVNLPYRAFDNGDSTQWVTSSGLTTGWLSYEFSKKRKIGRYALVGSWTQSTMSPKNWTFEGSNDGVSWTVLDTRENEVNWAIRERREYEIDSKDMFAYYRINVSANNGYTTYLGIKGLEMMEGYANLVSLGKKVINEDDFIANGLDKSSEVPLDVPINNKTIIEFVSATLGSGKVFNQAVDLKEREVNKIILG
ncbi:MAG: SPRY domain-containing protein [Bacillota bacterium]